MKTLTRISTDFLLQWILNILTLRKRKVKDWKMDMDQWIKAMDLPKMRNYLQSISVQCESLIRIALQTFEESRVHDILVCCIYLFMNTSIVSLVVPECLKMDQLHRGYILRLIQNSSSLKKLDFQCYNSTFYMSEEEVQLLQNVLKTNTELVLVRLPSVANLELVQTLLSNCPKLTVLILCGSKQINDEAACIIAGTHEYYIKGPLRKCIKTKSIAKRNLQLLDVSNTSIGLNGRFILQTIKNCTVVF